MKKIGILGGMSPESTAQYYLSITREYTKRFSDYSFPEIVIYSVLFQEHIDFIKNDDWDAVAKSLQKPIECLENAEVDFICLATNTTHFILDKLKKFTKVPFLSIIESTVEEIKKENCSKVGLLGTAFTMKSDLYKKPLMENEVDVIVPSVKDQEFIHRAIFTELANHQFKESTKKRFLSIIEYLVAQGSEGIILGCTEIPLIVDANDMKIPLFNTLKIHSVKALEFALN
ncbi:MAG: amino acid racemase [Caldisericia bacterium]|nr:amino acid racemase [Caldisericia bacterium]